MTFRDITAAKKVEAELREGRERLGLIVQSVTDYAIFTLDTDFRVNGWNPGAEAIFGYTEGEIVGRPGDVVFTPEDRAAGAPEAEAETARRDGRAADERWHVREDGSRFFASGVLTPLGDPRALGAALAALAADRPRLSDLIRRAARDGARFNSDHMTRDRSAIIRERVGRRETATVGR